MDDCDLATKYNLRLAGENQVTFVTVQMTLRNKWRGYRLHDISGVVTVKIIESIQN